MLFSIAQRTPEIWLIGQEIKIKNFFQFSIPETDPDRKPTFKQKTDADPNRLPKVNPAGLY
jgi:hypothetical protein